MKSSKRGERVVVLKGSNEMQGLGKGQTLAGEEHVNAIFVFKSSSHIMQADRAR